MTAPAPADAPLASTLDPAALGAAVILSSTPTSVCGETAVLIEGGFPVVYARENTLEPFRRIDLARGHAVAVDEEGNDRTVLIELADGDVWTLEGGYFEVRDLKALLARGDEPGSASSSGGSSSSSSGGGYSSGYTFTAYDPDRYGSPSDAGAGYSSGYTFTSYDSDRYGTGDRDAGGASTAASSASHSKPVTSRKLESRQLSASKRVQSKQVSSGTSSSSAVTSERVVSKRVTSRKVSSHKVSSHKVSSHKVSSHKVSSHKVSSHKVSSHRVASQPVVMPDDQAPVVVGKSEQPPRPPARQRQRDGRDLVPKGDEPSRYADHANADSPYDHDHEASGASYDHAARPYADHANADSPYDLDLEQSPYARRKAARAAASQPKRTPEPVAPPAVNAWELDADIKRILRDEGRFSAIQAYRQRTGAGLTEARAAVDALAEPKKVTGTSSLQSGGQNQQAMRFIWIIVGLSVFGWLMERCG